MSITNRKCLKDDMYICSNLKLKKSLFWGPKKLGKGTYGKVYLVPATIKDTDQKVSIKVIKKNYDDFINKNSVSI